MKINWKPVVGAALTGAVIASALSVFGQQRQAAPERNVVVEREIVVQGPVPPEAPLPPPPGDTFFFVATEMGFEAKPVKGAPYSAQAVTETTQTLSDGNRIVNKATSSIYRDAEGRTRREQTLRAFGPFAAAGDAPQTIIISDPVAGISYTLDPRTHVAHKMPAFHFEFKTPPRQRIAEAPAAGIFMEGVRVPPPPPGVESIGEVLHGDEFMLKTPAGSNQAQFVFKTEGSRAQNLVTEKLGTQVVEGVAAEGTRTTITIPAGEIGNERPIEMISERWYSQELKTVVLTRHRDPRFGETVYRLTNISREDPARSLFEVPSDYTVKDEPARMMRMKKPIAPTQ